MKTLQDKIAAEITEMICRGGGNSDTILAFAGRIEKIARRHIKTEQRRGEA